MEISNDILTLKGGLLDFPFLKPKYYEYLFKILCTSYAIIL